MTLLKTLISPLREKIGDLDPEHYQWSDSWLLDLLENAILYDYNEDDVPQRHEITGSGISRTINPSPTSTEKALMILFAAIRATNAETADRQQKHDTAVRRPQRTEKASGSGKRQDIEKPGPR